MTIADAPTNTGIDIANHTPYSLGQELRQRIEALDRQSDSRYSLDYVSGGDPGDYRGTNQTPISPYFRWVICWPVTGGSEGWYLHVEAVYQRDDRGRPLDHNRHVPLALIKIFGGWEAAVELAGLIGAWIGS